MLLREQDGPQILREMHRFERRVASRLLRVELRRLGLRADLLPVADQTLAGIALLPLDEAVLSAAETLSPTTVATLDAIHLATALRLASGTGLDAIMTYDRRLAEAARHHGLPVLAPE